VTADWYRVAFGELYPVVYSHRDDEEADRVAASYAGFFAGAAPVLDVACGAGRHAAAFGRRGVGTVGVDLSEFLLAEAVERRGLAGRVVLGDMRCLPFADASVAGAINMFTSFGYFDDEDDNRRVIREVARVMRPGALFLMDFMNADVAGAVPEGTTHRREGDVQIEEWRERDDAGRFVTKHVRVVRADGSDVSYRERVRLYTRIELEAMLEGSGLQVTERFGGYDAGSFVPQASSRLILLTRKRGEE